MAMSYGIVIRFSRACSKMEISAKLRTRQGRQRNSKVDKEDRLIVLREANRILEQEGVKALSLRKLSNELGTSYQLIYTLFGGKSGLLDALLRAGFQALERQCRLVSRNGNSVEHVVEVVMAYRAFALANPKLYSLMFDRHVGFTPTAESQKIARACFMALYEPVEIACEGKKTQFLNAHDLSFAIWGAVHGQVGFELTSWFGAEKNSTVRLRKSVAALFSDHQ